MMLLVYVLVVYGITTILTQTVGIKNVFYKLRRVEWLPFDCFYCTAVWVSGLISLLAYSEIGYMGHELVAYLLTTFMFTGITSFMYQIIKIGEQ